MPRRRIMTLDEVLSAYLEDCSVQGYTESTITGYRRTMRCFMRWAEPEGISLATHFDGDAVKRYIANLQKKYKWEDNAHVPTSTKKVSATTVRNYVRDLKAFASWLEREDYTTENVLTKVRKPKADEVPVEPFSQAELDAIFSSFDLTDSFHLRDYVILHLLWDTGMRVGEVAALELDDVNLKGCEIRIDHAKWGKWRDIGFGKQTQKYLSRYLTLCRPEPVIEGDRHFFLSVDGYPITVSAIQQVCHRISRRVGVRVHLHRFRHTFAVGMLRNGTDIRTLQKLMGHASVPILMRYLNLAHRVNSPADRHYAQKQVGARRMPMQQRSRKVSELPRERPGSTGEVPWIPAAVIPGLYIHE